jgi:ComF family protein
MSELTQTLSTYRIWQKKLVEWKEDLLHLIYPNTCLICSCETTDKQIQVCHLCETSLHYTHFETFLGDTNLDKLFWGRKQLTATFALLYFEKENSTQTLLHAIKYGNNKRLAFEFGKRLGKKLTSLEKFNSLEALIPIPLHPKKLFLRGYNQSLLIANGISEHTNIPVIEKGIHRIKHSDSQTKKGRFKRWENVQQTFSIQTKVLRDYQHIAIVDDVVTTGATIESFIQELQTTLPNLKISVLTLALAK